MRSGGRRGEGIERRREGGKERRRDGERSERGRFGVAGPSWPGRRDENPFGAASPSPEAKAKARPLGTGLEGNRREPPARSAARAGIVRGLLAQPAGAEAQRDHSQREQRQGAGQLGYRWRLGEHRRGRGQGGEEETSFHRDKVMCSAVGSSCGAKCPSRLPTGKNETDSSTSSVLLHVSGEWPG